MLLYFLTFISQASLQRGTIKHDFAYSIAVTKVKHRSELKLTEDTSYLDLTDRVGSICCEFIGPVTIMQNCLWIKILMFMSIAQCKIAISPLLMYLRYQSLALSLIYIYIYIYVFTYISLFLTPNVIPHQGNIGDQATTQVMPWSIVSYMSYYVFICWVVFVWDQMAMVCWDTLYKMIYSIFMNEYMEDVTPVL